MNQQMLPGRITWADTQVICGAGCDCGCGPDEFCTKAMAEREQEKQGERAPGWSTILLIVIGICGAIAAFAPPAGMP